jgi:hypothetical protein
LSKEKREKEEVGTKEGSYIDNVDMNRVQQYFSYEILYIENNNANTDVLKELTFYSFKLG